MEVLAGDEAALLEDRPHLLPRRSGIRRRLEHDEVSPAKAALELPAGPEDDRQVGLALPRQRGGKRDEDGVRLGGDVVVGRRAQKPLADEAADGVPGDVVDVALAAIDPLDDALVDVDENRRDTGLGEDLRQRQADVTGADDRELSGHSRPIVQSRSAIRTAASPSP